MTETQGSPGPSRRTAFGLAVLALFVVGYFAIMHLIRSRVDGLIQESVGKALPAFQLVDSDGTRWSVEALRGRPAVLHFFRSFCDNCEAEAPELRRLESELDPKQVTLLHVMTDAVLGFDPGVTAATLARKGFHRPVLMADRAFVDAFHSVRWSQVTPITYVVDAAGVIRFGLRGQQTVASVRQALAAVR